MRKAAHTVNRNARAGERHKWKDRERRRKEERQRMAAEPQQTPPAAAGEPTGELKEKEGVNNAD